MSRMVVLLCGPAGAGKTTAARQSGLTVYDRDDPQWTGERQFTQAIAMLAADPAAQAVVIRAGASSAARAKAAHLICATHVYLLTLPPAELARRVAHRGRHDKLRGIASIRSWYDRHDKDDGVQDFPGWDTAMAAPAMQLPPIRQRPMRERSGNTTARGYGSRHQALRSDYVRRMTAGESFDCWRCGGPIDPTSPWELGHDDHDRSIYRGPEHRGRECPAGGNRATAGRRKALKRWSL